MLIDTHAHLNFVNYKNDLDQVISRSLKNKVTKIICVSSNLADSQKAIEIAINYPKVVYAAVGIHPHKTDPENRQSLKLQIKILEKLASHSGVVAIGECGLDYSPASPRFGRGRAPAPPGEKDRSSQEQKFLFQAQIEIAIKNKLPLIIHTRQAFEDTLLILNQILKKVSKSPGGVFHCYTAGKKGIEKIKQTGFYFGVDGNLTYDPGLQNVFQSIPLEKIVLETDAPFLSPIPFRGSRNEPKNIKFIANLLAEIKKQNKLKISQQTSANAAKLFRFKL